MSFLIIKEVLSNAPDEYELCKIIDSYVIKFYEADEVKLDLIKFTLPNGSIDISDVKGTMKMLANYQMNQWYSVLILAISSSKSTELAVECMKYGLNLHKPLLIHEEMKTYLLMFAAMHRNWSWCRFLCSVGNPNFYLSINIDHNDNKEYISSLDLVLSATTYRLNIVEFATLVSILINEKDNQFIRAVSPATINTILSTYGLRSSFFRPLGSNIEEEQDQARLAVHFTKSKRTVRQLLYNRMGVRSFQRLHQDSRLLYNRFVSGRCILNNLSQCHQLPIFDFPCHKS